MKKVSSWLIALLGLWEFGDIAALFVPDFGQIQPFVWNHIVVGFGLMVTGVWAALTQDPRTARILYWAAAIGGGWLVIASFILRPFVIHAGLWNDVLVGAAVLVLSVWSAISAARRTV